MIHLVCVWLDLPMVWWVLLCAAKHPTLDFHEYGTTLHIWLSHSIPAHTCMIVHVNCWWLMIIYLSYIMNDGVNNVHVWLTLICVMSGSRILCIWELWWVVFSLMCLICLIVVMTHSPCAICVWILWWSRTLCSWEQMDRWIVMEDLVLEDVGKHVLWYMWHRGLGLSYFVLCIYLS